MMADLALHLRAYADDPHCTVVLGCYPGAPDGLRGGLDNVLRVRSEAADVAASGVPGARCGGARPASTAVFSWGIGCRLM